MNKYSIKQLSVFVENRKGELTNATSILFEENISIKSLLLVESTGFGILRLIVDNPDTAREVYVAAGYTVKVDEVFAVKVEDKLGEFHKVAKILSEHDINILYTYAFRNENAGVFVFKVDKGDFIRAMEALKEGSLELMEPSFFY